MALPLDDHSADVVAGADGLLRIFVDTYGDWTPRELSARGGGSGGDIVIEPVITTGGTKGSGNGTTNGLGRTSADPGCACEAVGNSGRSNGAPLLGAAGAAFWLSRRRSRRLRRGRLCTS